VGLIFLFVDGIGIAPASGHNPVSAFRGPGMDALTNGAFLHADAGFFIDKDQLYRPVDANLGIAGLPQSGTGQAALFSGQNAPALLGKHFGPWPHTRIKPLMQEHSIFHQLLERDVRPEFLNAYPPVFFERMTRSNRWSCSTLMTRSSGRRLRSTDDILAGSALSAELFGDYWRDRLNIELPRRDAHDIANIILDSASAHPFVMFEYYLTDKAGHARDPDYAREVLQRLDRVLYALVKGLDGRDTHHTLVICSDHGNLEDLSTKSHTRNPVPLLVNGPLSGCFHDAENITDVARALVEAGAHAG
jgi:hypothetical protein